MTRWLRLNADWEDSPWLDELQDGAASGCWPRVLSHAKRNGVREGSRCRVKSLDVGVASRKWHVSRETVQALLNAAVIDGALEIEGADWLIVNWETYQPRDATAAARMKKHRVTDGYAVTDRDLSRDMDMDVDRDRKKKPRAARATGLPSDWTPNDDHRAIGLERNVNVQDEAVKMRDWALAKGEVKKDWDAAFRNWLRRAIPRPTVKPQVLQGPRWPTRKEEESPRPTDEQRREGREAVRKATSVSRGAEPIASTVANVLGAIERPEGGAAA